MAEDRPTALSASGLHKRFGALDVQPGIDLVAHHGEVVAMIGASGSGEGSLAR